jgi:hypothetical protein
LPKSQSSDSSATTRFAINYIKSDNYREFPCDGALGGPTPKGKIWMALYSERYPLPRVIVYSATPGDAANELTIDEKTKPLAVESREGIVRNVEFGAYMDLEVAKALHTWLGQKISDLQKATK